MDFIKTIRGVFAQVLILGLIFFSPIFATGVPPLKSELTDQASLLNRSEYQTIQNQIEALNATGKAQLAVLIIPSLKGKVLEQYSLEIAEATGLGNKDQDNGVLLLVAINDRKLRIEVGYGLEGALTDALSGRIIDQIIVPLFKQGQFAAGISQGVDAISKAVANEPIAFPKGAGKGSRRGPSGLFSDKVFPLVIFGFIIFAGILKPITKKNPVLGYSIGAAIGVLVALFITGVLIKSLFIGLPLGAIFTLFISNSGGGSGGGGFYGGGYSSGGGFSGGGFSGGGGSFGGGGSSGGW